MTMVSTATVIVVELKLPALSFAVAVNVGVVPVDDAAFQEKLYGAALRVFTTAPFTLRLTELTPVLSVASTDTVIVFGSTSCPWCGDVILTAGGVASIPGFGFLPFDSIETTEELVIAERCAKKSEDIAKGTLLTSWASSATKPLLRLLDVC